MQLSFLLLSERGVYVLVFVGGGGGGGGGVVTVYLKGTILPNLEFSNSSRTLLNE